MPRFPSSARLSHFLMIDAMWRSTSSGRASVELNGARLMVAKMSMPSALCRCSTSSTALSTSSPSNSSAMRTFPRHETHVRSQGRGLANRGLAQRWV